MMISAFLTNVTSFLDKYPNNIKFTLSSLPSYMRAQKVREWYSLVCSISGVILNVNGTTAQKIPWCEIYDGKEIDIKIFIYLFVNIFKWQNTLREKSAAHKSQHLY
jgi:hypothetical protein